MSPNYATLMAAHGIDTYCPPDQFLITPGVRVGVRGYPADGERSRATCQLNVYVASGGTSFSISGIEPDAFRRLRDEIDRALADVEEQR